MKRKKFYIILAILTAISLFSFAAFCNQCGVDTGDKVDVEGDEADETVNGNGDGDGNGGNGDGGNGDENGNGNGDGDDDGNGDGDVDGDVEKEAPTITLEVYEGPIYSADDDVCYWRVEAIVTGNPKPAVEFNRDDSGGAWSDDNIERAQVNISSPGETFTLTATATNSEGSEPASIVLEWGCGEAEPEPQVTEKEVTKDADVDICGYIFQDDDAYSGTDIVYIGDTAWNKGIKGYISFDISSISNDGDVLIKEVAVNIPGAIIVENQPWVTASEIVIKVFYYGDSLVLGDFAYGGDHVKSIPTSDSLADLNFTSSALKNKLQDAVDISRENFQFKFGLNGSSNNGISDYYKFTPSGASLYVKYEVIE